MRNMAPHEGSSGHTAKNEPGKQSGQMAVDDMVKQTRMMNDQMMQVLGQGDAEYEKRFIDLIIPHHEGAIQMARNALQNANRPELKAMMKKALEDQQKEIEQLQAWREAWYGRNAK